MLAVMLAAAAVLSWMVLNDPNAGKTAENVVPSGKLETSIIQAAFTGGECSFSADDVNGYLAYLITKHNKSAGGLEIQAAVLSAVDGGAAEIYIPVSYKGKSIGVTMNFTPSCDTEKNRLAFKINSFSAGRLPVNPKWAMNFIKNKLPAGFTAESGTIFYSLPPLTVSVSNVSAEAKITELKLDGGNLKIQTASNIKF